MKATDSSENEIFLQNFKKEDCDKKQMFMWKFNYMYNGVYTHIKV